MTNEKKEIPVRHDPNKTVPTKDPDLQPGQDNPINPKVDEPVRPTDANTISS